MLSRGAGAGRSEAVAKIDTETTKRKNFRFPHISTDQSIYILSRLVWLLRVATSAVSSTKLWLYCYWPGHHSQTLSVYWYLKYNACFHVSIIIIFIIPLYIEVWPSFFFCHHIDIRLWAYAEIVASALPVLYSTNQRSGENIVILCLNKFVSILAD